MDLDSSPSSASRMVRTMLYVGAGGVLIVHGLAHAALAYRGTSLLPGVGLRVLLGAAVAIAMVGFVIAGLGLAGARPMDRPWRGRSLATLSLVASLVAFAMAWIPGLWPGLLLDAVIASALLSSSGNATRIAQRDRRLLRRVSTITASL